MAQVSFYAPGAPPAPGDASPRVGIERDPRADGRRRKVELTPSLVVFERRIEGISMRVGLSSQAFRGVAVGVIVEDGLPAYEVTLRHDDGDLTARLALCDDRASAIAALQGWARWFALPTLVERPEGGFALADVPRPADRRARPLSRRPRFLIRRKPGQVERMAMRFLGEREIICYE
jgi:hypothetical protein